MRPWQSTAERLDVEPAPPSSADPEPAPGLPDDVGDGDWVEARALGWDGRRLDGADVFDFADSKLVGVLTATFVEVLGSWRYSVDGQSVDPTSVSKLDGPPAEPDPLGGT